MKLIGAFIIIACCGWFGFSMASTHRREEESLRELINALDYMHCELQYKLTPLPELCTQAASCCHKGVIQSYFQELGRLLQTPTESDPNACVQMILGRMPRMPQLCRESLAQLGNTLGQFDLEGQLKALDSIREHSRDKLTQHCIGKDEQRRSFQTLGICAGSALVILFA